MQLSAYAQYYHDFNDKAKNHFDIMAGYEWAHFWHNTNNAYWSYYPSTNGDATLSWQTTQLLHLITMQHENYLVSFFGRDKLFFDGRSLYGNSNRT